MQYISYDFYKKESVGGDISAEKFPIYEKKARAAIDYYTFGRIAEPIPEKVRECMLELIMFQRNVEKAAEEGSGVVLSETVGDHTVHFADGAGLLGLKTGSNTGKTQSELEYEIIAKYLMSSGLMYRGVDL